MKQIRLREKVFKSAKQIVECEGMEQLSVRKLAQLSSCSIGSIYNVFGNFQDLQLHINLDILGRLYTILNTTTEQGIKDGKSIRDLFRQLGLAYIEFGNKNPLLWKTLFEHLPYDSVPEWYAKFAREGVYRICKQISKAFKIPEADSKKMVGFLWASVHGVSAIFLNRKMEMVAELFNTNSLLPFLECCLDGLFKDP